MNRFRTASRSAQTGVALITGLIFLVLLTIIGATAMQTTMLEEKMAGNLRNENLAFQAAEAALRAGESYLQSQPSVGPFLTVKNSTGLYQPALSATTEWWETADIWTADASRAYSGTLSGVGSVPRYIIEDVSFRTKCTSATACQNIPLPRVAGGSRKDTGGKPPVGLYRITAQGTGGTNETTVVLQSYFRR